MLFQVYIFMIILWVKKLKSLKPSKGGELEITNYFEEASLKVNLLGRGFAWFDTGSHKNLL